MPFREIYLSQHKNRRATSKATMPRTTFLEKWEMTFGGIAKDATGCSIVDVEKDGLVNMSQMFAVACGLTKQDANKVI